MKSFLFFTKQFTKNFACAGIIASSVIGCGGGSSTNSNALTSSTTSSTSSTSTSTGTTSNGVSLASGYKLAKWQSGVEVSFKDDCTMVYTSTGTPSHGQAAYYLTPDGSPTVAQTPNGKLALGVSTIPVSTKKTSYSINICPQKQTSTSKTYGGAIGWMISGSAMYNAYEANNSTVALADNVKITFSDNAGKVQTAAFIDDCNGHQTPKQGGNQYHYHSYSPCLSSAAGDTGGASHLIGVANDGFPIYSDRDINGTLLAVGKLDECNGIDSATPEFPSGVYHYVLPSGNEASTSQAAPNCLRGKVSASLAMAIAQNGALCISTSTIVAKLPMPKERRRSRQG